jgi:polyisoprenoid-binding protein YceI
MAAPRSRRPVLIGFGVVVGLVALFYGGVLVYTNFVNDPAAPLDFGDRPSDTTTTPATAAPATTAPDTTAPATTAPATTAPATTAPDTGVDGVWSASDASQVGYRVAESIAGVATEGVGRTNAVTGSISIAGTVLTAAEFSADMVTLTSDSDRRDSQVRTRILDVATYPTASFVLDAPVDFGSIPDDGVSISVTATGSLTLRGTTGTVTFELQARLDGSVIEVLANLPIVFADYGIPDPSIGPVRTEQEGLLEVLLVLGRD